KLIQLVNEKLVNGWEDPRMLTISGLRRRGVTASALRAFAYNVGITKYPSMTDMAVLEHTMRDEFNRNAARRLAVLRPIKIVLTNYPEGKIEELDAINNPEDPKAGTRKIPLIREIYIESDDFRSFINPNSLEVVTAKCEPALATAHPEERYQFERLGYFALDLDSTREKQVWNRTITLRDTWAKARQT